MPLWKDGKTWRYQFQFQGKRHSKQGFATKAEARAAMEIHRRELKNPLPQTTDTDFRSAAYEYLDFCQRKFSEKTYKEKRFIYGNFINYAGNLSLNTVTPQILEGYLATRETNSNYNKHRKNLCALFEWCFKRRLIDQNPCLFVSNMPVQPSQKAIPSQEEVLKMIMASGELRPFFIALYSLAARVNEINRLRWEDVNFEKRIVTLWTRKGTGEYRPQIKPMNDDLYEELKSLYSKHSGEWVFPNPETGQPYIDRRKQLKRICSTAGVKNYGFHAIRHHVASLLADSHKASLPTIQKMLGHARLTTTQRYVQSLGDGVREAANLLNINGIVGVKINEKLS